MGQKESINKFKRLLFLYVGHLSYLCTIKIQITPCHTSLS